MAIFYLSMKAFGRARGKSGSRATSGAAYRAGERIRDERTGHVYDHRGRSDVLHKEIVLPARLAARRASLDWALDRSRLWNAAERSESRRNARVAREFTVALPHELAPAARTRLARDFAQGIADRYGSAVDIAIHAPRGDARNFHAHLLSTTREITPDGLGRKTTLELSGAQRHRLGLPRWREEISGLREHWANLTNQALEKAQVQARVSHLSRAAQGLESLAAPRVPLAAYHMERRGARSFLAERIRERHRALLQREVADRTPLRRLGAGMAGAWRMIREKLGVSAAAEKQAELRAAPIAGRARPEMRRDPPEALEPVLRPVLQPVLARAPTRQPSTIDELARESALRWRAMREEMRSRGLEQWPDPARTSQRSKAREHENDHGFGL